ncbi:glycoside hydrolase family 127 protein, partial [bacterium]|nr:glycoside hydrolase family 127 protein [bacterium]
MYGKVNTSIRILAFFILVLVFMFQGGYSQEYKKDALRTIPLKNIELKGYVGDKVNLCIRNRITAQDADYLIEPFRHREEKRLWQTEFWGKWFTSAVFAYQYTEDSELKKKLDGAVRGLLKTQTADGYIGNYAAGNRNTFWDIWGIKYS